MKKLMMTAAIGALCATVATADGIVSSDIVGYSRASVPALWSVFAPVFKGVATENNVVYLSQVTPMLADGTALTGNAKVSVYVLSDTTYGIYGSPYMWYPTLGGWSADGTTKIADDAVTLAVGAGFAVYNNVKTKNGVESTAKGSVATAIAFLVSGEVDLVCQNAIPALWSVSGNNSPVKRYLSDFVPTLPDGTALTGDAKVSIYTLSDTTYGIYGSPYMWYSSLGGWSLDGTSKIGDEDVAFEPGEGFAVYNNIKTKNGVESTAKGSTPSAIIFNTTSPLAQ